MVICMSDIANFNEKYLATLLNIARENQHSASAQLNADMSVIAELLKMPNQAIKAISRSPVFVTLPAFQLDDLRRKPISDFPAKVAELNFEYLATIRHVCAKNIRLGMFVSKSSKEICEKLMLMSLRELNDVARSGSLLFTCAISGRTLQKVKTSVAKESQDREFVRHIPMLSMAAAL